MRLASRLKAAICALLCAGTLHGMAANAIERAALNERVSAARFVEFDVYLPLEHEAELDALLSDLQDPKSPNYHKWLTPAEFRARFAPSPGRMEAIQHELDAYGLTARQLSGQRIHVSGSAGAVEHVFLTELHAGTFKNGSKTVASARPISMPASMVSNHAVVVGLSGTIRMQSHSKRTSEVPANRYSDSGNYWFDDLKQAYSYPSFKAYTGQGVTIGILNSNDFNPADMKVYFCHEKLPVPEMTTVDINGGAPYDPRLSFETHLDLQQAGGMAPRARHVLYNLPDLSDANVISGLVAIVESNLPDVVSMSFGAPEGQYLPDYNNGADNTGILTIYDNLFKQGNAQGITFVASSGDSGAFVLPPISCFEPGATSACGAFRRGVESPASSPHVTAVGGTNLVTTATATSLESKYVSESAFADQLTGDIFYGTPATGAVWGSGGGDSIFFMKPVFQLLVTTESNYRTVPDLALQMGGCPQGAALPCGGDRSAAIVVIGGAFYGAVGTSVSAPDFAGLVALKAERLGSRLGNENYDIYSLAAAQESGSSLVVFRDDIRGDNGFYCARHGYNRVLGNGTLIGVNFMLGPAVPTAGTPQTPSNP